MNIQSLLIGTLTVRSDADHAESTIQQDYEFAVCTADGWLRRILYYLCDNAVLHHIEVAVMLHRVF
jgi:hypothetical protein